MLMRNAMYLLKTYTTVEKACGRYRASVEETGRVITFEERAGHVSRLRLSEEGQGTWRPRSLTTALRHALARGKTLPRPGGTDLLLSVAIERRGRALDPVASVMAIDLGGGPTHMNGADDEWTDTEAVDTVAAVLRGDVDVKGLLDWLRGRGGEVARFIPVETNGVS